ncbi:MAG: glutathione S-transferase N-terminal domain-containing protein [Chloroflexi bacterium]|nr:glutathione S-transferase N-terminal domain-containing protein [Chloroflexota bacterium]
MGEKVIMYVLQSCPTCAKARLALKREGVDLEERDVGKSQEWLDEARRLGTAVPIIVRGGRVQQGFGGEEG